MKIVFSSLLCFLITITYSQDHIIHLYGEALNPDKNEKVADREIKWITEIQNPIIEVFLPAKKQATGQAVMICPGGGYGGLAYDWEGTDVAKWLNGNGIAGIVLKYRMPDPSLEFSGTTQPSIDARTALDIIHDHAMEWNINLDKIGIMGFSAGGHLAAQSATKGAWTAYPPDTDPNDIVNTAPDFSILIYPVISMKDGITHNGSRKNLLGEKPTQKDILAYSNEEKVTEDTPPTFLVHSADDEAVPVENSLIYYQALIDHSVPVEMHLYQTGGHGYALAINGGQESQWPALCIEWLKNLNNQK